MNTRTNSVVSVHVMSTIKMNSCAPLEYFSSYVVKLPYAYVSLSFKWGA